MIRLLAVRTDGIHVPAGALSGGNQQKLVIGKWLMMNPRILLLNDPTRGIDVGTKQEMYQLLRRLAEAGAAILFYSTDYDELSAAATACSSSTTARSAASSSVPKSPSAR